MLNLLQIPNGPPPPQGARAVTLVMSSDVVAVLRRYTRTLSANFGRSTYALCFFQ